MCGSSSRTLDHIQEISIIRKTEKEDMKRGENIDEEKIEYFGEMSGEGAERLKVEL